MMEHSENNLRSEMEDLKSQLDNIKHAKVSISTSTVMIFALIP